MMYTYSSLLLRSLCSVLSNKKSKMYKVNYNKSKSYYNRVSVFHCCELQVCNFGICYVCLWTWMDKHREKVGRGEWALQPISE